MSVVDCVDNMEWYSLHTSDKQNKPIKFGVVCGLFADTKCQHQPNPMEQAKQTDVPHTNQTVSQETDPL